MDIWKWKQKSAYKKKAFLIFPDLNINYEYDKKETFFILIIIFGYPCQYIKTRDHVFNVWMSTRKTIMKNDKDLYRNLREVMEKLYLKNTVTFFISIKNYVIKEVYTLVRKIYTLSSTSSKSFSYLYL